MLVFPFLLSFMVTAPGDASGIAWFEDDWAGAKSRALASKQLVAVDVWATWCHTCLSMKNYVLTAAPMKKVRNAHAWLSLDYDRPENGAFFEKFPATAFPTFMVIDPKTDTVVARWMGSGTAEEMATFFGDAKRGKMDALAKGQRALATQDYAAARKIFEALLETKTKDKVRTTRILSGYIEALWKTDKKSCAEIGFANINETNNTAPGIDFVAFVADCASALEAKRAKKVMAAVRDRLAPIAGDDALPLSVDDRSGLYGTLIDAYEKLGEHDKAEKAVAGRLSLLEAAAAAAKTAAQRSTFDSHRLSAYIRLKRFTEADQMLAASEKADPKDFNHPWRRARLYLAQERTDEGLAAITRALKIGYGARRLRLYSTKVDLLLQKKQYDDARQVVGVARAELEKMNPSQVRKYWVDELESRARKLEKLGRGSG